MSRIEEAQARPGWPRVVGKIKVTGQACSQRSSSLRWASAPSQALEC